MTNKMYTSSGCGSAPRSLPGGVVVLFLAMMTFQVGLHIVPKFLGTMVGLDEEKTWLSHTLTRLTEQAEVLDEEPSDLGYLTLPAAESTPRREESAPNVEATAGEESGKRSFGNMLEEFNKLIKEAGELQAEAEQAILELEEEKWQDILELEAGEPVNEMPSTEKPNQGVLALPAEPAENLPGAEQAQREHEERMQGIQTRKEARAQARKERNELAQTWSDVPGATQAKSEHEQRMQEIEARRLARLQTRREKKALAEATVKGFAHYFRARKEAQAQRRLQTLSDDSWAKDLPGGEQAQADHAQRMMDIEARKQARNHAREASRANSETAMEWEQDLPGAQQAQREHEERMQQIEARKQARQQAREEKHALAQATQESFQDYFRARKEMQAQRRKDRNWAEGLPGADQAQTMHKQWKEAWEQKQQQRQRARKEKRALAQATQDGFLDYFKARKEMQVQRRKDRNWAQDLPGGEQAQRIHETWKQDFELRRQARQHDRKEKRALAQKTQAEFQDYFRARKEMQAQRRKDKNWAQGLPGAEQAQTMHEAWTKAAQARKVARQQARKEKRDLAQKTQQGFKEYFRARKEMQAQRRHDRQWATDLPGAEQAQTMHETWKREFSERKLARLQARKDKRALAQATQEGYEDYFKARKTMQQERRQNKNWAQGLPGAEQAQAFYQTWKHVSEVRRLARLQKRQQKRQEVLSKDHSA